MSSASRTTSHPVGVAQLVSSTIVPGRYRRAAGTVTPSGESRNPPAERSSIAPKTLGESILGRQSHSTFPLGATRAVVSQSERNPYSPMGGNGDSSGPAAPGAGAAMCSQDQSSSYVARSPPSTVGFIYQVYPPAGVSAQDILLQAIAGTATLSEPGRCPAGKRPRREAIRWKAVRRKAVRWTTVRWEAIGREVTRWEAIGRKQSGGRQSGGRQFWWKTVRWE